MRKTYILKLQSADERIKELNKCRHIVHSWIKRLHIGTM